MSPPQDELSTEDSESSIPREPSELADALVEGLSRGDAPLSEGGGPTFIDDVACYLGLLHRLFARSPERAGHLTRPTLVAAIALHDADDDLWASAANRSEAQGLSSTKSSHWHFLTRVRNGRYASAHAGAGRSSIP